MAEYTISATDEQDQALAWLVTDSDPPITNQDYLQARNEDLLNEYVKQHKVATASSPPTDVAVAYAKAPITDQQEIDAILGLSASKTS